MNPQQSISSGKPSNDAQNILFFLPLVGIAIALVNNIYSAFGGPDLYPVEITNLLFSLGTILPTFIGTLLIAFLGMTDWRRAAVLLLGVEALLSIGSTILYTFGFLQVDLSIIHIYGSILTLITLVASILLIVNKKGGSALVRLSGLTFLLATIFSYVTGKTIGWLVDLLDIEYTYLPYIYMVRNLISLALSAIGWITLAMGVIKERSNKA